MCDDFADQGYLAIAPAIFDRIEPGVELGYDADGMARGLDLARGRLDQAMVMLDIQAAIDAAAVAGRVGVVGYCFGGLLTWLAACRCSHVACASSYYGGGVPAQARLQARCPVIFHFGERDAHIPVADVEAFRAAQPDLPVYLYAADHGFNCDQRDSWDAQAAGLARQRTLALFEAHLRD